MAVLAEKVDNLIEQVASLQSHIGNLCNDYCTEDIELPEDILSESDTKEWKTSCAEFHDLKGVNTKAL